MEKCGADQRRVDDRSHAPLPAIPTNCEFESAFSPKHGRFRVDRTTAVGRLRPVTQVFDHHPGAGSSELFASRRPYGKPLRNLARCSPERTSSLVAYGKQLFAVYDLTRRIVRFDCDRLVLGGAYYGAAACGAPLATIDVLGLVACLHCSRFHDSNPMLRLEDGCKQRGCNGAGRDRPDPFGHDAAERPEQPCRP